MNGAIIAIGLVILLAGASGIYFVTVPSVSNIGHQVGDNLPKANTTGAVVASVGSAVVSGVVLWFTTGFFIVLIIGGIIIAIIGLAK